MIDVKTIYASDRKRIEFALRAAVYFDTHADCWTFTDADVKGGELFAIRWAVERKGTDKTPRTISVLVFELPYDSVLVGDLDTRPLTGYKVDVASEGVATKIPGYEKYLEPEGPTFNHSRADGPFAPCNECLQKMTREQLVELVRDMIDSGSTHPLIRDSDNEIQRRSMEAAQQLGKAAQTAGQALGKIRLPPLPVPAASRTRLREDIECHRRAYGERANQSTAPVPIWLLEQMLDTLDEVEDLITNAPLSYSGDRVLYQQESAAAEWVRRLFSLLEGGRDGK